MKFKTELEESAMRNKCKDMNFRYSASVVSTVDSVKNKEQYSIPRINENNFNFSFHKEFQGSGEYLSDYRTTPGVKRKALGIGGG